MDDNINSKENKALLFKYLTKQYQKEKGLSLDDALEFAEYIMQKRKNELFTYHGLAYELGAKNLEFFCLFFLADVYTGEDKAEIASIHREIWQEIEDIILHKTHDNQCYLLPRGTGKSSFVTLATSVWTSTYAYKRFTLICSAIGDTAITFIRNIRMAVSENKRIEQCFGVLYDGRKYINNTEQIELSNRTMIQSISASSSLRGKSYGNIRVELLLLDDYQKDDEVKTADQRDAKWKRFSDDANYAIQKGNATLIGCGTIQHKEDFYSRLKNSPVWKTRFEKGVLLDDIDDYFNSGLWAEFKSILFDAKNEFRLDHSKEFYFQHQNEMQYPLLWQSYWDCLDLALQYYANPQSFKQEVQGDVDSIGQKKFTTLITESPEKIESHDFKKTILVIDPAASTSKKADFSAFVVGSETDTHIKYIRKGEVLRLDYDNYTQHTIELLKKYTDITTVIIEKNLYMGADVLKIKEIISRDPELSKRDFTWINEMARQNKDDRIETCVADVNFGRIIFNESDTDAIQQMRDFAGCDYSLHDDFPDAIATFNRKISEVEEVKYITFLPKSALF